MSINPCAKDCPNRSATCHAECEKYAVFAKEREEERQAEWKERQAEARMSGYVIERNIKARKRRRKESWTLK